MMIALTDVFETAKDNMDFDRGLVDSARDPQTLDCVKLRIYSWVKPGVTLSYRQILPKDLGHIDHATRPTGGGILFHSPHDLVFAFVGNLSDPRFKGRLRDNMSFATVPIINALQANGITASQSISATPVKENRDFCQTYENPYEIHVNGEKIAGITIRRFRTHFLIQGLIHVMSNFPWFPNLYRPYFSRGLPDGTPAFSQALAADLRGAFQSRLNESSILKS